MLNKNANVYNNLNLDNLISNDILNVEKNVEAKNGVLSLPVIYNLNRLWFYWFQFTNINNIIF